MGTYTQPKLQQLATVYRQAVEALDRHVWGVAWQTFPEGSCDVAHQTLARIIQDRFGVCPIVFAGEKHDATGVKSHVWLELDGLIIDVTMDTHSVLVTYNHSGHNDWDAENRGPVNFAGSWWQLNCGQAYAEISKIVATALSQ